MANYTAYCRATTGLNLYAKPYPFTNPWGDDDIPLTEGIGGQYSFTADSTKEYVVFVRAGASPAATDEDEVTIPKNTQITIDEIDQQLSQIGLDGSETVTFRIRDGGVVISGAEVYITSDAIGSIVVASGLISNALGDITCRLDPGTYYAWVSRPGYTATNPQTLVVTDV